MFRLHCFQRDDSDVDFLLLKMKKKLNCYFEYYSLDDDLIAVGAVVVEYDQVESD